MRWTQEREQRQEARNYRIIRGTVRRAVLRMNQAELARRAGVAQSYISMIENGERPLTDELLQRIAVALECKPEHLLREFQDVA